MQSTEVFSLDFDETSSSSLSSNPEIAIPIIQLPSCLTAPFQPRKQLKKRWVSSIPRQDQYSLMVVSARDKKEPQISNSQENTSFYEKPMKELHALSTLKHLSDFEEGYNDVISRGTTDLRSTFSTFKGWNGVEEINEEKINGQRSGGVLKDRTNSVMNQLNQASYQENKQQMNNTEEYDRDDNGVNKHGKELKLLLHLPQRRPYKEIVRVNNNSTSISASSNSYNILTNKGEGGQKNLVERMLLVNEDQHKINGYFEKNSNSIMVNQKNDKENKENNDDIGMQDGRVPTGKLIFIKRDKQLQNRQFSLRGSKDQLIVASNAETNDTKSCLEKKSRSRSRYMEASGNDDTQCQQLLPDIKDIKGIFSSMNVPLYSGRFKQQGEDNQGNLSRLGTSMPVHPKDNLGISNSNNLTNRAILDESVIKELVRRKHSQVVRVADTEKYDKLQYINSTTNSRTHSASTHTSVIENEKQNQKVNHKTQHLIVQGLLGRIFQSNDETTIIKTNGQQENNNSNNNNNFNQMLVQCEQKQQKEINQNHSQNHNQIHSFSNSKLKLIDEFKMNKANTNGNRNSNSNLREQYQQYSINSGISGSYSVDRTAISSSSSASSKPPILLSHIPSGMSNKVEQLQLTLLSLRASENNSHSKSFSRLIPQTHRPQHFQSANGNAQKNNNTNSNNLNRLAQFLKDNNSNSNNSSQLPILLQAGNRVQQRKSLLLRPLEDIYHNKQQGGQHSFF